MAPLPPKQAGIFKKILKCYDHKQYKMGLKLAKQILSNPETANHGETLAMKGLTLNCLGKTDEAHEYVRRGLRNDLTSHVCWHVYGLLQRSEHKYDEAIKCYRNALKYDKDNITILRDLSLLQIQMRDFEGYRDTRYRLFMLRSAQRVSWMSFALAYHLLNDYTTASKILDEFRRMQKQQKEQNNIKSQDDESKQHPEPIDYEQSELLLYQVMILTEAKNHKEALDFLNRHASQICDRLAVLEFKTELFLALNRNNEAAKLLEDHLISRNQENYLYYAQLEQALCITHDNEDAILNLYKKLQQRYPRSQVPFKIPIKTVQSAEKFRMIVDEYLRRAILRGLPALFTSLKDVYLQEYTKMVAEVNQTFMQKLKQTQSQYSLDPSEYIESSNKPADIRKTRKEVFARHGVPSKIKIVEDLMLSYEKNIQENCSFDSDPSTKGSGDKTSVLYVYYYLAQHYDYLGDYEKAMDYIKLAEDHTPTLIELLTLRAKVFKHMGEIEKAIEPVTEAQRLDTADRYLNSKCVKYLMRANKLEAAEDMSSRFIKDGVGASENLNEMQCMWYHIETAHAYHRMQKYGEALVKCYHIEQYFSEVTEDQFDFHTYCLRKMTLRAYIKLLRMEDIVRSHKFYFAAAELAITIYLKLHDEPLCERKENQDINELANKLSAAEIKKIKSKERKAAAKQQNAKQQTGNKQHTSNDSSSRSASNNNNNKSNSGGKGGDESKENNTGNKQQALNKSDINPFDGTPLNPRELEQPKDALEKAIRFLQPLKTLAMKKIDTHLLAFEVYRRKGKLMLMLQSVKRAQELDANHRKVRAQLKQLLDLVDAQTASGALSAPISKVLEIELPKIRAATVLV